MAKVVTRLMELFRGCARAHGTHGVPERDPEGLKWNIKRTAKTLLQPVTEALWDQHVRGKRPLGVIPIREDSTCSWGSIDFDEYDVDLLELVRKVEDSKLPLVPCRSKSGGLHLFLFLRRAVPAGEVLSALRDAAASLGMAECEIFPKQSQVLTERADVGNWMVMPYFGDDFGGKLKMQHGLKRTGAEMTIDEFLKHAEKSRTNIDDFVKLCVVRRFPPARGGAKNKRGDGKPGRGDFSDGPPCLQHLSSQGTQRDGRKRTLFMMALYFKRSDPSTWKERLEEANRKFTPPLPSDEVTATIKSADKKDYEYTCKVEPMRSHCNSTLCRMRKFGVGKGGEYPLISGLTMLETEPPVWFVNVGDMRLELDTEELQNYQKFHKACMMQGKTFMMVRADAWFSTLAEAMDRMTKQEAPPDVGMTGQFHELLEEFLTNRARGTRKEDLLSDRPWEDEGEKRHYFTMRALMRHLAQEGMKELNRRHVRSRLLRMGGGPKFLNFKNQKGLNTWWVPSSVVQTLGELEPPPAPGDET